MVGGRARTYDLRPIIYVLPLEAAVGDSVRSADEKVALTGATF